MNLLNRIDQRLNDPRYGLQQSDFEDCAAALIGHDYPGLVPVTGGTDHGLDAELVKPNGQILGLIITSSRTWEGAKKSLRGSLTSARDHKKRVDQVVVANLVEVNRQKRIRLAAIAMEFKCELIQVYDRPWFANALRDDPVWRRKILHIEGGAFSLSRSPRGARPDEHQLPTVGRDDLLDRAENSDQDLILWGVPGAGKSHVAGRLPGALFLERNTASERLLDDLLAAQPKLVVVDDAGGRTDDIEHLLHARHAENLEFRVAVTCWPHERESVADHIPDALPLEVDLLTVEDIATLLRERGITRTSVVVHLLQQAQGRPAWALNLADLLVQQGAWQAVWTGQALRDQIRAFLRRSKAPAEAIQLLAAIALVSDANEDQTRTIAKLFELSPTQFEELIRSVAIAGLVDVRRNRLWNSADGRTFDNSYRVVPRTIAASIVADIYFAGHATAVRVSDIKNVLPELLPGILQTQIYAALLGAEEPMVPAAAELLAVLPGLGWGPEGDELLRTYALINPECTRFVFEYLKQAVQNAAEGNDEQSCVAATKVLAARVADSLQAEKKIECVALFFASLTQLAARGWDYTTPILTVVEDVQDARNGDFPTSTAIVHLCAAMASEQAQVLPNHVWVKLACCVLQPTFDGNYMDPEKVNSLVMQSFTWLEEDIYAMYDALEPELFSRIALASNAELADLIEVMSRWARIGGGYPLPFGGVPNSGQQTGARRVAVSLAEAIAPLVATPGLRAVFNREASGLDVKLDEADELFAALTTERDLSEDWEEDRRVRDAELDRALAAYIEQPPSVIMTWLVDHDADLAMLNHGSAAWSVMVRLSRRPNPEIWLRAALDYGLGRVAIPLISNCVVNGVMTIPLATELLGDAGGRGSLISSVVSECQDAELASLIVDALTVEDIHSLGSSYAIRHAPDSTRHALFAHPDPTVRSSAAALWAAEVSYSSEEMPDDPDWATAMSDLVVPSGTMRGHMQSKALIILAKTKPETYMTLLARHVEALEGYDDFDEWEESARELSSAHRFELWNRVRERPMAMNLFWVISAADVDWITKAVSDPTFPLSLSQLLHATRFQFGKRYPLKVLAVMLRPLKWQPDDLLWTLEVGTHWGEDHERLERHLEVCRELVESPEPDLARLGERGVETFGPRLAEAKAAARRAAVRGTLGY